VERKTDDRGGAEETATEAVSVGYSGLLSCFGLWIFKFKGEFLTLKGIVI
jgi:hypothetical protein